MIKKASIPRLPRRMSAGGHSFFVLTLLSAALFPVAVRADAYDPPANYYSTATGTGATLKAELYTITSAGFVSRSYGDSRYTLGTLWQDPNNTNNLLEIYRANSSVPATWDSGVTYNREHIFPQSWLGISVSNTYKGYGSDLFELAPANPSDNSSRGNNADGYYGATGTPSKGTYGNITGTDGNQYWNPGTQWLGDVSRTLFYMATRYGQGQGTSSNPGNLSLKNGPATTYTMGDLNSLLHWAYEDPVDTFERRKNEYIYSSALNPSYYQGNRNPYIDHPEYIWAVFGTSANSSQISVGAPAADGSSAAGVNFGKVIVGSSFSSQIMTINKTGATPTTFNVSASGTASSTLTGTGEAFDYNAGSKSMVVGLATPSTAGPASGTVTVHNTDLTSAGAGQGSADGDDTVTVTGTAVDHSNASFSSTTDTNTLTINFGTLHQGSGIQTSSFNIANLLSASGYTAALDLDSINGTGNTDQLYTNLATFSALPAGTSNSYLAEINTSATGNFSAEYTLTNSDENIPGATAGANLVLDLTGSISTGPQNLTWSGNTTAWDVSTSANWNSNSAQFNQGDIVTFDDSNTGATGVTINSTVQPASVTVSGSHSYSFSGTGSIADQPGGTTTLTQTGTGTLTVFTANTYTGATTVGTGSDSPTFILVSGGSLASNSFVVNAGATASLSGTFTSTPAVTVNGQLTATANDGTNAVAGSILVRRWGTLSVGSNATLTIDSTTDHSSRTVLVTSALTNSGLIDLQNNDLVLQNTVADSVFSQLQAGFNSSAGYWNGAIGITSSSAAGDPQHLTTLGYRQSDGSDFDTVHTSPTDTLIKFTYIGDANLDGTVNGADYQQIDAGYGTSATGWSNGDFNYDGAIDGSDYSLIDNTFNQLLADNATALTLSAAPAALLASPAALTQSVPEPTAFVLLIAPALLIRRRRRCMAQSPT